MELKDWEKLSPEEQQRHLGEKPVTKCSASLIEIRNAIKRELDDEASASHKYADMAGKFTHLQENQKAQMLRLISNDELLHQAILAGIVDEITVKCGE